MNPVLLALTFGLLAMVFPADSSAPTITPVPQKNSPQDLTVSGDIPSFPGGTAGYIPRSELEKLPHVTATVTDDSNFSGPAHVEGVSLDDLMAALHVPEKNTLVVGICDDAYEAYYTEDYRAVHRPILVLDLNGKPLPVSQRTADGGVWGPYLITHAVFKPRYTILSHPEEAQIPNGLLQLRFLDEDKVLAAIRPQEKLPDDLPVEQGYRIAREDCFRCHNQGEYGGHKANRSWQMLGQFAKVQPAFFAAYIRDPKSQYSMAQMPGEPNDDDATIKALTAYFATFAPSDDSQPGDTQ